MRPARALFAVLLVMSVSPVAAQAVPERALADQAFTGPHWVAVRFRMSRPGQLNVEICFSEPTQEATELFSLSEEGGTYRSQQTFTDVGDGFPSASLEIEGNRLLDVRPNPAATAGVLNSQPGCAVGLGNIPAGTWTVVMAQADATGAAGRFRVTAKGGRLLSAKHGTEVFRLRGADFDQQDGAHVHAFGLDVEYLPQGSYERTIRHALIGHFVLADSCGDGGLRVLRGPKVIDRGRTIFLERLPAARYRFEAELSATIGSCTVELFGADVTLPR